jgi:hypothetical protein
MRAFARLRAQRRLSGSVVFALLILGALSAGHHHRLVVQPDAAGISAPSAFDPMARATECVVCRAADPARIVLVDIAAPQVDITSFVVPTLTEHAIPAAFRPCSPRAPPVAIA